MKKYNDELMKAFDEWSDTYETDAETKIIKRGCTYDILASHVSKYFGECTKILELGTGTGILGKRVKKELGEEIELTGVDISKKMLSKARSTGAYTELINSSADEFISERKYDGVYSSFMFHSVGNQKELLNNIYSLLRDDTYFIIIDLIPSEYTGNTVEHSKKYEFGAPSNYLSYTDLCDLVEESKFKIHKFEFLGEKREFNHYFLVLKKSGSGVTYETVLEKVKRLHKENDFKNTGGEDKVFRLNLMMEELGEICASITKDQGDFYEENADLFILLLGNIHAYNIDILNIADKKLDRLLSKKSYRGKSGRRRIVSDD